MSDKDREEARKLLETVGLNLDETCVAIETARIRAEAAEEAARKEREKWWSLIAESHSLLCIQPEYRDETWESDRISLVKRLESAILTPESASEKEEPSHD